MKDAVPLINRISFRVPLIVLIVLCIGIGATIVHFLRSQNMTIIESKGIFYVCVINTVG